MGEIVILVAGRHPALRDGGSATYVRAWGRAAILAGYEPHIFCIAPTSRVEATAYGVVHSAGTIFRPFRTIMLPAHGPPIVRAIERFAAPLRGPFLIHSFGCWGGVGLAAARRLAGRGIRCVTAVTPFTTSRHEARGKLHGAGAAHGSWTGLQMRWEIVWNRLAIGPSERRGLGDSDLVLVNYESVGRIVASEIGAPIPFRKITYAPETAFLRGGAARGEIPPALAQLEPKDAPLILAVSRHDARKGLDVLLRALALLSERGVRFRACLAGTGALLEKHRRYAAHLGLLSCTALPGRVADVGACLDHAAIFALPSIEEGSGSLSLLEAMQAGVAPVVSRIDGLPEDVTEGESALLVEPANAGDLADALRRLIENPRLRAQLARGAQARFRERHSAAAFAAEIGKVYASLGFAPAARAAEVA